ncbi:hypothetical protein ES705_08414 [subsurface metagenome]
MDISKAKKVVELTKGDSKILVTLYEGGQVASCIEDEDKKKYCETCQADDETCQQWIEHLKSKGYQATEVELGKLGIEESLPRFLEQRESAGTPTEVVEKLTVAVPEVASAVEPEKKPEGEEESAVSESD